MSSLTILGDTSGSIVLDAPAVSGSTVLTLPARSGTLNVGGPAFSVYNSVSNTNFSTTTWTKVLFDVEEFDTANCFSSSRFTPNVAGYYQISCAVNLSNTTNLASANQVQIFKNGTFYKAGKINMGSATINDTIICVSSLVYLNGSTDYVEVYCYEVAGGQPVYVGASGRPDICYFNGCLVRAA